MIDFLTRGELADLLRPRQPPCVSIYMPTREAGDEIRENRIRLKNLIDRAEERLIERRLRAPTARKLVAPARGLLEVHAFWEHQSNGLAMFLAEGAFKYYRLPVDFEELAVVGSRFHMKPLLSMFANNGRFFVLALSQQDVRLLQGTRYQVSEIDLPGLPKSVEHSLRFDDPERQLQFHTSTGPPGGAGERRAQFHGHSDAVYDEKEFALRHFQRVDKVLQEVLRNEQAPLVLAGVEYVLSIYREANTYRYLTNGEVTGNPEMLRPEELQKRAWEVVEPLFMQAQEDAAARFRQAAGTGLASTDVADVVPAAYHGRVDTVLVVRDKERWGRFDPESNEVELHEGPEPGDEDLLDTAAFHTLANSGAVYVVSREAVPNGGPIAAVYRY